MDTVGNKVAQSEIAQIKVVAPNMALRVIDRAIQVHGAAGLSQDFPLAGVFAGMRALRMGMVPTRSTARRSRSSRFASTPARLGEAGGACAASCGC